MIRIPFDLADDDIAKLDAIGQRDGKSRTAVLREAVAQYRAVSEEQ